MQPLRAPVRFSREVFAVALMLATLLARPASAQTTGQWTSLETWPYRAIFTTLQPNGKVYFYSYYSESLHPQIWDPATKTVSAAADAPYELFCSGLTGLADGRIFITGGHIADYVGYPHAIIYDPNKNSITQLPDMNAGRWYPTNTVLPNGDVLVVSGDMTSNTTPDPLPQVWQFSTNSWRNLTTAQLQMPLYPVMFVAPNGKVFNAGPSRTTRYLDTSGTGSWSTVATMNFGGTRDYGPGVMYDVGKVLEVGGSDPPTATAEIIDLNSSTPAWKYTSSMHYARRQHNAVVLPDGKVLVVGGSSGSGFDNSSTPVYPTEMWDPATGQWTVMASIATYRGYHSTAILLPDGRVLSAGGNVAGPTAQIFSPPYLFNGARPTITSAPGGVGYGQTVFVGTPDATSIAQVSFIRLPATTHTFDMSTRFMRLTFTQASGGLNVTMPANANIAPPGYYMLFILNSAGVPSVAQIVQITPGGGNSTTGTVSGTVTNTSGAPLGGATVSGGGASTQTLADGTYTLANVTPGTVTLTASLAGYASASEPVSVTAGSTTSAATLALAPSNPGNVTGTIVKNTGVGISGATVTAEGVSALTNSSGVYTLNNLPAGTVTLTASAPRYQAKSETVTVTGGTTTTAPTMTLISATGAVKGTVMSTSGTAIAGALLSYGGGQTTSNSTGSYLLTGIPPGTIQLVASASGYASQTQNVNIVAGSTATANYTLSPSTTTTGTVTGKVTNISTGAALTGATVTWGSTTATTNTSGVYTLSNVTSGTQSFTAKDTGYVPRTVSASVAGGATTTLNIPLATGGRINVTVKTSSGALVSGAHVSASGGMIATTVSGTSNTSGVYLTPWIPIGSYNVTVSLSGFTTQTKTVSVTTGNTISVTFTGF